MPQNSFYGSSPIATLWDMDGTIVDSESVAWDAAARAFREVHGIELPVAEWTGFHGQSDHAFFRGVCDRLSIEDMEPVRARFAQVYAPILAECELLPGVRECMVMLARFGPQAIVSGSTPMQIKTVVETHGLDEFISLQIGSGEYPQGKPAPDPFLMAAERLRIPPQRCLVLEDSRAGVASGLAAGSRVIGIKAGNIRPDHPHGRHDISRAHLVLDTLEGVTENLIIREIRRMPQ